MRSKNLYESGGNAMLLANYANTVNRADATATMPIISAMNVTPHKF